MASRINDWKSGRQIEGGLYEAVCGNENKFIVTFANLESDGCFTGRECKNKNKDKNEFEKEKEERKSKIKFVEAVLFNFYKVNGMSKLLYNSKKGNDWVTTTTLEKYTSSGSSVYCAAYFMLGQLCGHDANSYVRKNEVYVRRNNARNTFDCSDEEESDSDEENNNQSSSHTINNTLEQKITMAIAKSERTKNYCAFSIWAQLTNAQIIIFITLNI